MELSARMLARRPIRARAVGAPTRLLASLIDAILPSIGLFIMVEAGALRLDAYQVESRLLAIDQLLVRLGEQPMSFLYVPIAWMLMWTCFSLISLGTVSTTLGKRALGLSVRQADGKSASGGRMLLRVVASWLVPLSLGLAWIWMIISVEKRTWPDQLSATYVVRVKYQGQTQPQRSSKRRQDRQS